MSAAKKHLVVSILLMSTALLPSSWGGDRQKAKVKYLASGQKYMKKGQYASAVIEYRNALKLDPRFVDAYYQLAQADLAQHDWRAAYDSLGKAIALDPNRLDARVGRGGVYLSPRAFVGGTGGWVQKAVNEPKFSCLRGPHNLGSAPVPWAP